MKRLLAVWLSLCFLPLSLTVTGAATPPPAEDWVTVAPSATPEATPAAPPVIIPPDPNWVPAEEPDDAQEAFAPSGLRQKHHGMRPLSRYAQTFEVTEADLVLAARVAYFEAGPRSERAYRAVLCVLYNRCVAKRFGGEVTDIETETFRKGQFSVVHNKRFKTFDPPEAIIEAARDIFVYGNLDLPENILFFCAERIGKGFGGRKFYRNIGGNLFFYGSVD
ncbi:MAG: cell wall hydrolase [Clostridia bacterium]|nr:cell wall hydrolase [Clostridia bacterium]